MKAKALVQRPANTIRQLKAKTSSGTLHDKKVKRLVEMPADRQPQVKAITVANKDGNVQAFTALYSGGKASTSAALEKKRQSDIWWRHCITRYQKMDETLGNEQGKAKVKPLLNALVDTSTAIEAD